jgi:hypothetical protein
MFQKRESQAPQSPGFASFCRRVAKMLRGYFHLQDTELTGLKPRTLCIVHRIEVHHISHIDRAYFLTHLSKGQIDMKDVGLVVSRVFVHVVTSFSNQKASLT